MSGQDMRKIMENLNTETPKKKTKLDESMGGTPIANDIMELAAKLEAIQNAPETEEVEETLEENLMPDQRSVTEQLTNLVEMANKHGLYDAADWLTRAMSSPDGVMKHGAGALLGDSQ